MLWLHNFIDNLPHLEKFLLHLFPILPQALLGVNFHGQVQTISSSTETGAPQNHLCSHNKDCKFCAASLTGNIITEILRPHFTEGK